MTIERVLLTQRCCKYSEYKWQNNPFSEFPDFISYLILGSNCNFLLAIDCENDYVKIRRVRPFAMKMGSKTTRFLQNDSTLLRKASSISTHTHTELYLYSDMYWKVSSCQLNFITLFRFLKQNSLGFIIVSDDISCFIMYFKQQPCIWWGWLYY